MSSPPRNCLNPSTSPSLWQCPGVTPPMLISESHLETIQFLLLPSARVSLILWDLDSVNQGDPPSSCFGVVKTNDIKHFNGRISQYLSVIAHDVTKCTRHKTYLYWSLRFDERKVYVQLSCSQEWFSPSIVVLKAPCIIYGPSLRWLAPSLMLLHFIPWFSTPLYVLFSSTSSALHCLTSALFLLYYFLWFLSWKRIV